VSVEHFFAFLRQEQAAIPDLKNFRAEISVARRIFVGIFGCLERVSGAPARVFTSCNQKSELAARSFGDVRIARNFQRKIASGCLCDYAEKRYIPRVWDDFLHFLTSKRDAHQFRAQELLPVQKKAKSPVKIAAAHTDSVVT